MNSVTKRQESEEDPFTKEIGTRVIYPNSDPEWMKENMDFKQHALEMERIGREEGRAEERKTGFLNVDRTAGN